jgi:hypothetical protein
MKNRFDLEENLMKCWHVTDDLDMLAEIVGGTEMNAKDQDKLLNIIIGMKEMYNARFSTTFEVFEELIKNGNFEKTNGWHF